jgi:hypothetical protein
VKARKALGTVLTPVEQGPEGGRVEWRGRVGDRVESDAGIGVWLNANKVGAPLRGCVARPRKRRADGTAGANVGRSGPSTKCSAGASSDAGDGRNSAGSWVGRKGAAMQESLLLPWPLSRYLK